LSVAHPPGAFVPNAAKHALVPVPLPHDSANPVVISPPLRYRIGVGMRPGPQDAQGDQIMAEEPVAQEVKFDQSRVLVVDDNAQNLELLVAYLDTLGCKVVTAGDGVEALNQVRQSPFDLILLDIMMPRMSGFEVCSKLKSDPRTRDVPIIMVTALSEMDDIGKAVQCGADDFLSKPINKLELLTRVKSLLRVRHLKGELDRTMAYLSEMENRPESE